MILDEILVTADLRAEDAIANVAEHRARAARAPEHRSLEDALGAPGLSVIAELKRRSPSAGVIDAGADPVAQARSYASGGCAAISVLTEPHYFDGSLEDLEAVRGAVSVPVLRKDFTRSPAQIWEARASGADAVLLIVAALDDQTLSDCLRETETIGIDAIVEVHTETEAGRAVESGARIIGVNNRDLGTFVTDLGVAERIATTIADAPVRIAESGVSSAAGARRMAAAGYDAILVGEALMRHDDPAALVMQLRDSS